VAAAQRESGKGQKLNGREWPDRDGVHSNIISFE
jgi:hypothetical protein